MEETRPSNGRDATSALVEDHLRYVRALARRVSRKVPRRVLEDDLYSAGLLGCWQAAMRYDVSVHFLTFARTRIWGAMMDHLREEE